MDLAAEFNRSTGGPIFEPRTPQMSDATADMMPEGLAGRLDGAAVVVGPDDAEQILEGAKIALESLPEDPALRQTAMENIQDLVSAIQDGTEAFAAAIPSETGEDLATIVSPDPQITKFELTQWEGTFPGHQDDWYSLTMLHENIHLRDFHHGGLEDSQLHRETIADYGHGQEYYQAYREGIVGDPEVPYAFRAIRAENVMLGQAGPEDEYTVNAIMPLPREQSAMGPTIDKTKDSILAARDEIYEHIGEEISVSDPEEIEAIVQEQPELLYEAAKLKLARGDFDDNPAGKKFAENFIDGAQRYKPDKYGVEPQDIPAGRPAIVEQLSREYTPGIDPYMRVNPTVSAPAVMQ